MHFETRNDQTLKLANGSTTSLRPILATGPAGSNVLPTDAAIAAAINTPDSATDVALAAGYAPSPLIDYSDLMPWFAAAGNRALQAVPVVVLGDSTLEGVGLSAFSQSLGQQLATQLRARFPVSGVTGGRGYLPVTDLPNAQLTPTGMTALADGYGPNGRHVVMDSSGDKVTVVLDGAMTSFDLVQLRTPSGFNPGAYYKIDGGSSVSFDTYHAATYQAERLHVASAVATSLEIGWSASYLFFSGVIEYKGDEAKGIQVHNLGWSGSTAAGWNASNADGQWPSQMALFGAQLVIVQLGINDAKTANGNRTSAQFGTDLTTLVTNIRTAAPVPVPIVLSMPYDPSDGSGTGLREAWVNYVDAAKAVAAASASVVCLDHSVRMPAALATDTVGLQNGASPPHASAKGYALMAATLVEALTPR